MDPLPRKRFADPKRQSASLWSLLPPPISSLRFILRRSVQIAEELEAARALRSADSACCAPPGDELLLSRASRSRTSRGLSPCRLGLEKAQIAKNNIALDGEGENNRIGSDAGGDGGGGCCGGGDGDDGCW